MQYNEQLLKDSLIKILNIPSPTGYTEKIIQYIKDDLSSQNILFNETNKGALIVSINGKNDSYQRTFSAHVDTLGAMVKGIKGTGAIALVPLGGYMMNSIDGENCTITTLNGDNYSGTVQSTKPSVHISGNDARELKRTPENMEIIIDEKVFSKVDVEKLGINVDEQKMMNNIAIDIVVDSVSVATTFKKTLNEKGIIFCSISEAIREYP